VQRVRHPAGKHFVRKTVGISGFGDLDAACVVQPLGVVQGIVRERPEVLGHTRLGAAGLQEEKRV
jgi:hypothetical protein